MVLLYVPSVVFIKILLLMMQIRIFSPHEKLTLFIRALAIFIIAYYFAVFIVRIFMCTPISAFWTEDGKCVNLSALFIVDSFVGLITDGTILVLPIFLAWSLNLPLGKKIKVAAILGAGGLTTVTNIYRLYLLFANLNTTDLHFYLLVEFCGYVDFYSILSTNLSEPFLMTYTVWLRWALVSFAPVFLP